MLQRDQMSVCRGELSHVVAFTFFYIYFILLHLLSLLLSVWASLFEPAVLAIVVFAIWLGNNQKMRYRSCRNILLLFNFLVFGACFVCFAVRVSRWCCWVFFVVAVLWFPHSAARSLKDYRTASCIVCLCSVDTFLPLHFLFFSSFLFLIFGDWIVVRLDCVWGFVHTFFFCDFFPANSHCSLRWFFILN